MQASIGENQPRCPQCGGETKYRDSRTRKLKGLNGEIRQLYLRRLSCQKCKKLHTELPDIIQPYKHYDSYTIQSVIENNKDAAFCVADNSTMRRWKKTFLEAKQDITQRLISIYTRTMNEKAPIGPAALILAEIRAKKEQWLSFVMSLLINSGHKLCTQFAFCQHFPTGTMNKTGQKTTIGGNRNDKTIYDSS
jgi:transposase